MASDSPLKIIVEEEAVFTPPKRYREQEEEAVIDKEHNGSFTLTKSEISLSKVRRGKCGQCVGCLREDCGKCRYCKDKVKFGGTGRKKQKCVYRKCIAMSRKSSSPEEVAVDRKRYNNVMVESTPIKPVKKRKVSSRVLLSSPDSSDSCVIVNDKDVTTFSSPKKSLYSPSKHSRGSPHKTFGSPKRSSRFNQLVERSPKKKTNLFNSLLARKQFGAVILSTDCSPFANLVHVQQIQNCSIATEVRHLIIPRPIPIPEFESTGLSLGMVTNLKPIGKEVELKFDRNEKEIISVEGQEILKRYQTLNREFTRVSKTFNRHDNQLSLLCSVKIVQKDGDIVVNDTHYRINGRRRSKRLSKGKENLEVNSKGGLTKDKESEYVNVSMYRSKQEVWCDLYQPHHSNHLIGNGSVVSELLMWLNQWKNKCQGTSDIDLDDSISSSIQEEELCPALVISGLPGVGKTAAVYACASELNYKVLEINSTQQRTRQYILSSLREATLSHQMTTGPNNKQLQTKPERNENTRKGILSFFQSKNKLLPPTTEKTSINAHGNTVTLATTTLILLDEVDILFDDETKGFWSSLYEILLSTKRPFIFTTNEPNLVLDCPYKKLIMTPPTKNELALHCRLLALSHDCHMTTKTANQITEEVSCDTRKLFNTLQFWITDQSNWTDPLVGVASNSIHDFPQYNMCQKSTTHEDLNKCISISDTVAAMDISDLSHDMSHDLWWKCHVTDTLIDELPSSPVGCNCTEELTGYLYDLLEQQGGPNDTTESTKKLWKIQKDCSEVFHVRTILSRSSLILDCIPILEVICQHELLRQEMKLSRRFSHYIYQHNQDHLNQLACNSRFN